MLVLQKYYVIQKLFLFSEKVNKKVIKKLHQAMFHLKIMTLNDHAECQPPKFQEGGAPLRPPGLGMACGRIKNAIIAWHSLLLF